MRCPRRSGGLLLPVSGKRKPDFQHPAIFCEIAGA
jgi:hypothetical protein